MKYLLIDFGASYIKTLCYNSETETKSDFRSIESPFLNSDSINKKDLINILESIVISYKDIDRLIVCSILGGHYSGDVYNSWKIQSNQKNYCLISGLFQQSNFFHLHEHHKKTTKVSKYETGLKILGYISGVPIYSALSDTGCVIESLNLDDKTVCVNMGTGSQVIYKTGEKVVVEAFIPSGRSLLVFKRFFDDLKLDFFYYLKNLSFKDIEESSLDVDLNLFKGARKYKNGGQISLINENNFNIKNLVSSTLKCYVKQYSEFIKSSKKDCIVLTGGIPKKLPIIKQLFKSEFPLMDVYIFNDEFESTHLGMISMIKRFL